jgi:polysaccharide biosynthesis/export protein
MGTRIDRHIPSRIRRTVLLAAALLIALAGVAPEAAVSAARKKRPPPPTPVPTPVPAPVPDSHATPPEAPPLEHLIGPEDLLEISVFEVPQLSRTVRVSEAGSISLPLLGELSVSGLTVAQLETRLREALSKGYVEDPQVSVFVKEYSSRKVSVIGAVGAPGVYELLGPRTLLEVLSQAGGLTERSGTKLYILRTVKGDGQQRIIVNVSDLMERGEQAHNVSVEPGDIISVPIDRPAYVYVDGAVRSPGRVEQLASRPLSLLQAIARAGGPTDRADIKNIQILRKTDTGEQTVLEVNLKRVRKGKDSDPPLRDGDIIVVRETFF